MTFRLDRFLTLYFFGPLTRLFPSKKGVKIPILMYHSISDELETGHAYFWINTSPARFAEHMKFLHTNNYRVISLSTAVDLITGNVQPITGNLVVLTFDDGYLDFYTQAFPVLKERGFSATVFLPTAYIDGSSRGLKGKQHLNWKEVKELQAEGINFGSHTINHAQLFDLKREEIEYEIKNSRKIIEEKTGNLVDSFCYPNKFPEQDKAFIDLMKILLQESGYKNGLSARVGTRNSNFERYFLKRVPINSRDDFSFFKKKMESAYDWVYFPQRIKKSLSGSYKLRA